MEPAGSDTDPQQDPLNNLPELDTITGVSQGFIPESLFFWRRRRHPKPS